MEDNMGTAARRTYGSLKTSANLSGKDTTQPKEDCDTIKSRLELGFPENRAVWRDSPATFSDHSLSISGHPVMEDWEAGYMQQLAAIACSKGGQVLEVGFGMGISAGFIQQHAISGHTVIEANTDVYGKLEEFSVTAAKPLRPMFGFWEEICSGLPDGSFSGILFDTYPLAPEEIHKNHFAFFGEAYRLLRLGGILTYYSDEALDFSLEHQQLLTVAGFTKIGKFVCPVNPPPGCKYWQHPTLLVPIITK